MEEVMEETISVQEILHTLKKRFTLIVTAVLLALIVSAIITYFILTPRYEASTQILVNQSQPGEEVSSTDLQSSRELINTYNVILNSPAILEPVVEESNYNGSTGSLSSNITVESEEESQVATVTIEDTDPEMAVTVANTLATTFVQEVPDIMNVDNVSILSEASIADSDSPVSPQPALNLFIALMIGSVIGIVLAFLLEFLDKSIKDEQDVEKELELPILGVVPTMKETEFDKSSNQTSSNKSLRSKNREERKTS